MEQVFTFRLLSGEDDDFVRDFEIRPEHSFLDFHHAIQKNLNYDPGMMASFFTSDDSWQKIREISLMNMTGDPDTWVMDKTIIDDVVKDNKDRLLYVFDYLSNRGFFIELVRISEPEDGKNYPYCSQAKGKAPEQLRYEDFKDNLPGEEFLFGDTDEDDLLADDFEDPDNLPDF